MSSKYREARPSRITSYSCGCIRFVAGQVTMYSFALKTQRTIVDARRHDGSRQLYLLLLALSRYDRHVRRAPLCWTDCDVAVLAVNGRRQKMLTQELGVLVRFEQKRF